MYLGLGDLGRCSRVCRQWRSYLDKEESATWYALAQASLPDIALADPFLLAGHFPFIPSYIPTKVVRFFDRDKW